LNKITLNKYSKKYSKKLGLLLLFLTSFLLPIIILSGCSSFKVKDKADYLLKTEPEKAVIDFLSSLNDKTPEFIYDNLLTEEDKNSISKEKFSEELNIILSDVESLKIEKTTYLGYEKNLAKVVAEFSIKYTNGEEKSYKKYIYLIEENKRWKIVFEKTFI